MNFKKITLILLLSIATLSFGNAKTGELKPHHINNKCSDCHVSKDRKYNISNVSCDNCHDKDEVAIRLEGKYKEYYNPHDSIHFKRNASCIACHREHSKSRLSCNSSQCHSEFKYEVK